MRKRPVRIETVPIGKVKPDQENPRTIGADAYRRLKRGIETFGMVGALVVREDYTLVGGHQRLRAMRELGRTEVLVVRGEWTDEEASALNVLLNNPGIQGTTIKSKLAEILSEMDAHGYDATLTGYDVDRLEKILTWAAVSAPAAKRERVIGDEWRIVMVYDPEEYLEIRDGLADLLDQHGFESNAQALLYLLEFYESRKRMVA